LIRALTQLHLQSPPSFSREPSAGGQCYFCNIELLAPKVEDRHQWSDLQISRLHLAVVVVVVVVAVAVAAVAVVAVAVVAVAVVAAAAAGLGQMSSKSGDTT